MEARLDKASGEAIIKLQEKLSVCSLNRVVLCLEAKLARLALGKVRSQLTVELCKTSCEARNLAF